MDTIQTMFLALLRVAITDEPLSISADTLPLVELYKMSKKQDLAHLIALGLEKSGLLDPTDAVGRLFVQAQYHAVMRYEQQQYEYERVCALLERCAIPFIPLKGAVMRQYYPEPWMRTSCDIDILIQEADVDKAADLLAQELQFSYEKKTSHDVSLFSPGGVHFELHFDLMETEYQVSRVLRGVWEEAAPAVGYRYCHLMPDELYVCYHIAHMAKHFSNGGCGVRPFIDLWLLQKKGIWSENACQPLLEASDLDAFTAAASRLAAYWFSNETLDALTEAMQTYLLSAGVYGSLENIVTVRRVARGSRIRYVMARVFMPCDQLAHAYPALHRHKWLLPYYQVVRWIRLILNGIPKRIGREVRVITSVSKERTTALESMLNQLKLYNKQR